MKLKGLRNGIVTAKAGSPPPPAPLSLADLIF